MYLFNGGSLEIKSLVQCIDVLPNISFPTSNSTLNKFFSLKIKRAFK